MKNIIIVSFGKEISRVSYDTVEGTPKATTYEPSEMANRGNCLTILVHSLRQLQEIECEENVGIYSLSLLVNFIGKLYNTKKTLSLVGIEDKEKVLTAFYEGMNIEDEEKALWSEFYDLDEKMSKVKYKKLPNKESVASMKKSSSGFNRNLAKAIETAWNRLPQVEMGDIEEDEAI